MRRYESLPVHQHRFLPQFPISHAPSSKIIANVYYTTGTDPSRPTLVAIKGVVFDVSRNSAYGASGSYRGEFSTVSKL